MVQAINELGDDRYSLFSKSFLPESLKTLEVHIARTCNNAEKTALKLWPSLATSAGPAHMGGEHRITAAEQRSLLQTPLKALGRAELDPVGWDKCAKGLILRWHGRALALGTAEEQEGQGDDVHPELPFPLEFTTLQSPGCSTCVCDGRCLERS